MNIKRPDNRYIIENLNMDISDIAFASLGSEWKYGNARSRSTRIYLPVFGEGFLDFKEGTVKIIPGKIYIIPSMFNFAYRCEARLDKFYAHVSIEKPDGFDALEGIDRILIIDDEGEKDTLEALLRETSFEAALNIKLLLLSIITRAIKEYGITLSLPKGISSLTARAIDYVNSHLSLKLKVSEIAEALFVSRLTLSNTFTKEMNVPIGKFIDERVMLAGERDLISEKFTVSEISEKYGFCDRFYFTRRFSEKFGKPPKQYLRHYKYKTN